MNMKTPYSIKVVIEKDDIIILLDCEVDENNYCLDRGKIWLCAVPSVTCSELKMVKSQASQVLLRFTANSPNTHVSPRTGRRTTVARNSALYSA